MYTSKALRDIHQRTHQTFAALIHHCESLSAEALNQVLAGFGYPTVHQQIHHAIGGERYWMGVLQGRMDVDEDGPDYPTVAELETLRARVFAATEKYLKSQGHDELNQARKMITWGNREKVLVPAHVVLRTQTHIFHHGGQIAAMCRLLGHPSPGSDYPVE